MRMKWPDNTSDRIPLVCLCISFVLFAYCALDCIISGNTTAAVINFVMSLVAVGVGLFACSRQRPNR